MKPYEIKKGIYWVGAIDWNLRVCGSYNTPKGTTYNAYLIIDEKSALIDAVKTGFEDILLSSIKESSFPSL